jgi:DNA-binding response OmpR family regulator
MLEKANILVVDDKPMNVELLKAILESNQYHVMTALNGSEALELLAKEKIDLVLLDIMMPAIDGFEVTRRIRADEKTKGLPIVLITAYHETSVKIAGIEAGCDDFITKPFDKVEMLARIKTLLRLNYYRSQAHDKEKFEQLMNRMNDGLIVCDGDLKIVRSNQKARDLLNFGELSSGWLRQLGSAFRLGHKGDLDLDLRSMDLDFDLERPETPATRPLILNFSSSLIKDTDGKAVSVVIVLHDVTVQRKEQFGKENFLSLMSDKMRLPLAVSLDHLALLQKATLTMENKPFKKSIEITVDKVTEFLRMMEKIFDFLAVKTSNRFDANKSKKENVSVGQVMSMVKDIVKKEMDKKVECNFMFPKGLSLPIGKSSLEIILKNLIENSIKFSDQEQIKLTFSAEQGAAQVRFTASDNGPGIPSEEQRNVFDAFYQVYKRGNLMVPGQGLGLAIAKRVVETNQGKIKVDHAVESGTSISFIFPSPPTQAGKSQPPVEALAVS